MPTLDTHHGAGLSSDAPSLVAQKPAIETPKPLRPAPLPFHTDRSNNSPLCVKLGHVLQTCQRSFIKPTILHNGYLQSLFTFLPVLALSSFPSVSNASQTVGYATYYTVASCQREGTSGVTTASGEPFIEKAFTCAIPNHQFGGLYEICAEDKCVTVRHNDYGPGKKPQARGVVIDLSPAAFKALAPLSKGKIPVTVRRLDG